MDTRSTTRSQNGDNNSSTNDGFEPLYKLLEKQLVQLEAQRVNQEQLEERLNKIETEFIQRVVVVESQQREIYSEMGNLSERLDRIDSLGDAEERLATVNAKIATTMHKSLKEELGDEVSESVGRLYKEVENQLEEFQQIKAEVQKEGIPLHRPSETAGTTQFSSTPFRANAGKSSGVSSLTFVVDNSKPIQRPTNYDGQAPWEAYFAQFQIYLLAR